MPLSTPVLIIGGGPVGLCLALFLDYWDIPCTILNTGETARIHPKGNGQNARTMEHYRQIGISDEVRKLGLPSDHPFDQGFFTTFSAHKIFRYPCPSWNEREEVRRKGPVTDQFVEPMFRVNQMYVEQYLLEKVRGCKNVDVRFGWEAVDFVQSKDGVTVHACKVDNTAKAAWFTDYVVDCSGGRSFIRRRLGIDYVGDVQTKDAHWAGEFYTIWLRISKLYPRHLGRRRAWMNWAVNADPDTGSVLIALNGKDEFEMMIKAHDPSKGVDAAEVKTWTRQAIGADIEIEVLAYAPWTAGAALAVEKYRKDRIFLAGDSAHLFTPVGAFGMNTGIDDAHNLAWKLAALFHGWGGPKLLESYEIERRPIGFRNTGACRKYSTKWLGPEIPDELEVDTPGGEEARKKAAKMGYIQNNHFVVLEDEDCTGVQLGARYDDSPLIVPDGKPPEDNLDIYHPSGVPGGRVPHIWLDGKHEIGSSLFDRLRKGFTLLLLPSCNVDTHPLEKAAEARNIPFKVLNVFRSEAAELYERSMLMVRPDQYIAWRGDALPEDCDKLLDQVCGF